MNHPPGPQLALLLLGGFNAMVDEVVAELARRGHPGVRPVHEFALRAIDSGADTAAELGRRLSVTKQAAAKTTAVLEQLGYVRRGTDPHDRRRKRIQVTARGREMTEIGAAVFNEVRDRWSSQVGAQEIEHLEAQLRRLVGERRVDEDGLSGLGEDPSAGVN